MTKDYQEVERIAEGVAMRLDGRTVSGHEQFREMVKEEVVKALTTYGNAREQATVEEIVGVVEGMIEEIFGDPEMNINIKRQAKNKALTDLIKAIKK